MFKICNGLRVRRKQNLSTFFCMYACNPPQVEHFATDFGFFGFKNLKKNLWFNQNQKGQNFLAVALFLKT